MQSQKLDRLLRVSIVLLAAVLVYVIYAGIHERVVAAGDSAPGFTLATDQGRSVSLSNFGGKILVLNFWASWCPPCVDETPAMSRFAQQYAGKGVVVLGISVDKDEKAYRAFLEKYKPAFLTARESQIHADYGTYMYPESYVIDATGKVLRKWPEEVDWLSPETTRYFDSLVQ